MSDEIGAPAKISSLAWNLAGHFGHLADAVVVCRDGCVAWATEGLADLCAVEFDALEGQEISALWEDSGDGTPNPGANAGEVICRVRGVEEAPRFVAIRVSAVVEGEDRGEEIWAIRDATQQRHQETELLRVSRVLREAQCELEVLRERAADSAAEREQLLAVVSHELRTPITVISGYSRLLLSEELGALSADQQRFLRETAKSCKHLDTFIGNLLEASRDPRAGSALNMRDRSLESAVLEVTGLLRPLLDERGLRLELELDPKALRARFDALAIEQVMTNLLGNAIRYAKNGGVVSVGTRCVRQADKDFVAVTVCDDGSGVAQADQERIFQPYVRGVAAGGDGGGSLGLGLAICKRIVEAHGGSIAVRDSDGGGSCFEFTLRAGGSDS